MRLPVARRTLIVLWLVFGVWLALGVVGVAVWWSPSGEDRSGEPGTPPDDAEVLLIVAEGRPPHAPAFALAVWGGSGSRLVLLPATTVVEVPGVGPRPLEETFSEHGAEALAVSVANALRIRVPDVLHGTPGAIQATVDRLGGIEVEVPETVEVEEGGVLRTEFVAGTTTMDPDAFLRFLTESFGEERELERVARQDAAWRGLLEQLAVPEAGPALTGWEANPPEPGRQLLLGVARDPGHRTHTLPVRRVGVTEADLYRLDTDERAHMADVIGDVQTTTAEPGRRIRLLVGTDAPVGTAVARRLVDAGYVIVLTGRASEPYAQTRVVIGENAEELRREGRELVELLGTGQLGVFRRPQTVFDVTLVVGQDWAEAEGLVQHEPEPERG